MIKDLNKVNKYVKSLPYSSPYTVANTIPYNVCRRISTLVRQRHPFPLHSNATDQNFTSNICELA